MLQLVADDFEDGDFGVVADAVGDAARLRGGLQPPAKLRVNGASRVNRSPTYNARTLTKNIPVVRYENEYDAIL